ncbi:MAG: tetratricopeptide repeat protein, partial [Acidobacteria bacterium]|nr:tetratricopeptide repeat protein [Acidobacteriota bacterium]
SSLDLDASAPLELDLSMDDAPLAAMPVAPVAPPPPTRLDSAVDLAAAELAGEAGDDLDFITEHLTEAEVFAKYGLAEKAAEHLRAIIERAPKHLVAYERLYRIVLDEGDVEGARALATQYVNLLQEKGDDQAISAVVNEFMARGLTLAPAKSKTPTVAKPMPVPPPPPPSALEEEDVEELSFDLEPEPEPEEVEMSLEPEPEPEPVSAMSEIAEEPEELIDFSLESEPEQTLSLEPEEETLTLEPEAEPSFSFDEPSFEMETASFELETPSFETPSFETPSFEAPSFETPSFESPSFETPAPEPELSTFDPETAFAGPASTEPTVGEPFFGVEALGNAVDSPAPDELGEIDFYIEQELLDVARDKVSALLGRYPDNPELEDRIERIARAAAASTPLPPPTPPPPALSRDEIESELLSAIPDDDDFDLSADEEEVPTPAVLAPPPPAPAAPPPPAPSFAATSVEEQNLFADEDDFFDLAAELESELEEDTEVVSLSEEEQSLEEIFKEFKKGVEQQLDSEDYDTHYNLGIAYKEMGLIDEAIGEFQLASKDPKRAVECASMLGLCFLEKGMPQLAIKWYRKGLEMPEITEEEHVGLLYDLGSAYMEVGDTENAQKAFVEVYGLNTNYRDIVSRIKQLEDAKR